jgi:hypothetical protein
VAAVRFDPAPEFRIMPERAIVSPKFGAIAPAVNAPIRKQGRIVGVFRIRLGDATGWCKELKALPILNVPVTSGRLFHKVFNRAVEKKADDLTIVSHLRMDYQSCRCLLSCSAS